MFRVVYKGSLAHAEMAKDVVEGFLGGDLTAGDVGEMVEGEAEVFGNEVGGEVRGEAVDDAGEGVVSMAEGFVVAGAGDDDIGV